MRTKLVLKPEYPNFLLIWDRVLFLECLRVYLFILPSADAIFLLLSRIFAAGGTMKKADLFIIKSYIGPLAMTFFIAVFILLMQFLWKYVDDLVGKGLEWYIIAELLFYASATFVPLALPMAILLASLMTFGNLGERYELVALKSSGLSLRRIMQPLVITTVLISGVAFFFSNNILPVANLKFQSILFDVRKQKLALNIDEGVYYDGIEGYVIRVAKKSKDQKTVKQVMIYDHTKVNVPPTLTVADSGYMDMARSGTSLEFTLYHGINYDESADRKKQPDEPFRRMKFDKEVIVFDLTEFALNRTNEDLFRKNYKMLNLKQLNEADDSLRIVYDQTLDDFVSTSINRFYFLNRLDSLQSSDSTLIHSMNQPDFLDNFSETEKLFIIGEAQEVVRKAQKNVRYRRDRIDNRAASIRKYRIEWHRKFTLSFACLLLFFIGAPLGAIIRKGGLGTPLVVSVVFFVIYHIITTTGQKYATEGGLTPFWGMWIASFIILPLGAFLTAKASSDAQILDAESWEKFFERIKNKISR